jgi:hypothetical protein
MSPAELRAVSCVRAGTVATAGAALGVIVAVALSPLTPLPQSTARRAELHPGVLVDWTVLLLGGLAAVLLVTLAAVLPAFRQVRRLDRAGSAARPTFGSRLTAGRLPVAASIGVRFALEPGRGPRAVPVRSAIVANAAAVTFVVGAAMFATSLDAVRHRPERYGVTWNLSAGDMATVDEAAEGARRLALVDGIHSFSGLATTLISIKGKEVEIMVVRPDRGWVGPLVVEGRAPATGEIAFGATTMRALHVRIGDTVQVDALQGAPPAAFRVVGRTVLNAPEGDSPVTPGKGGLIDWSGIARLLPADAAQPAPQWFLIRLTPHADKTAVTAAVRRIFPTSTSSTAVEPADIANLAEVSRLPLALGGVISLLGLGTVTHALLSVARRRRHELAVLKSVGFTRGQLYICLACQSLTFGVIALAVGIPLGIAAGRGTWGLAASHLAILNHPIVPALAVLYGSVVFAVAVLLIAFIPARLAGRVPASVVLRKE